MVNVTPGVAPPTTTTIDLPRFGTITYAASDVLTFPWGLPGFEDLKTFVVLSLEEQAHLVWLQSLDNPAIALPAADPWMFFPDYEPKLPGFARLSLELDRPEDFTILAIVVVPEEGEMFMNLMAPVLVNLRTRIARQVALETGGYSVATPIPMAGVTPTDMSMAAEAAAD